MNSAKCLMALMCALMVIAPVASHAQPPRLTVSVRPTSFPESSENPAATGTVTRTGSTAMAVVVTLFSSDTSEATVPATVTIAAGQNSATFPVNAVNDDAVDGSQFVVITAGASNFTSGTVSIIVSDDDVVATPTPTATPRPTATPLPTATPRPTATPNAAAFSLSITPRSFSENAGSGATAIVTRNSSTASAITVSIASSDTSEATVPSSIVIAAGETAATFVVRAVDDNIIDGTQTVRITAFKTGFQAAGVDVSVLDNDVINPTPTPTATATPAPTPTIAPTFSVSITPSTFSEAAGAGATGTVTRNSSTALAITVSLSSSDTSEATVPSSIVIPAGAASATFVVRAVDDTVVDGTQTVRITAFKTGFTSGAADITVLDNDVINPTPTPTVTPRPTPTPTVAPALTLTLNQSSVAENGGAVTATLSRNANITITSSINIVSSDTSEARVPATVTLPAGSTSVTFLVTPVNDDVADGAQIVTITASKPGFQSASARLTVTDDEVPALQLSISPGTISEGGGANAATATLTRRNVPLTFAMTVTLSSSDPTEATVQDSIVIPAGQASVMFPIAAVDDTIVDGPQRVAIRATKLGLATGSASVQVLDNDASFSVVVNPTTFSENAGNNAASLTVTRSSATNVAITVDLASSDESEVFVPPTATIPVGSTSVTIPLAAINDSLPDGPQTVRITASKTGFIAGFADVTVTDDDLLLALSVSPTTISENAGAAAATGTLTRNGAVNDALIVNLTSDDTSEARVPATVTIPAGSTTATFPIDAVNDGAVDGTQTVVLTATSSGFNNGTATLRVTDDDARLTLTITPATFSENAGQFAATGTIIRNTSTTNNLTVTLVSSDTSEATVPRTVVIPAGSTSATFVVAAVDDTQIDGSQTVVISASAASLRPASAQVTVTDDDARLTLAITPTTFSEAAGHFAATGTVTRNTATTNNLTVTLRSSDTTEATVPATVVIPAGVTSATFTISAVNDNQKDGSQTVTITASAPAFVASSRTVIVTDDD